MQDPGFMYREKRRGKYQITEDDINVVVTQILKSHLEPITQGLDEIFAGVKKFNML